MQSEHVILATFAVIGPKKNVLYGKQNVFIKYHGEIFDLWFVDSELNLLVKLLKFED